MSSADWIEIPVPNGKPYFWNPKTDETSWEIPDSMRCFGDESNENKRTATDIVSPGPKLKEPESFVTGTSSVQGDDKSSWRRVVENGEDYWWNLATNETRWELPTDQFPDGQATVLERTETPPSLRNRRSSSAIERSTTGPRSPPALPSRNDRRLSDLPQIPSSAMDTSVLLNASGQDKLSPPRTFRSRIAGLKNALENGAKYNARISSKAFEEWSERLKQLRKERGPDVGIRELLEELEISNPYDVQHKLNVRFHHDELRYTGLPDEWGEAQTQFGVPLHACPRVEVAGFAERIPSVLVLLRKVLEDMGGLKAEGIFRISPGAAQCQQVKEKINNGLGIKALEGCVDPHIPANLIKQFFRDLTPNLLNVLTREQIMEMSEFTSDEDFKKGLSYLQEPARSVFLWMLDLLSSVAVNEHWNRMSAKSLAIVLSPNVYSIAPDQTAMETLVLSQKIAELLTKYLNWALKRRPMNQT